ncbi:myosin-17 [Dorcoceras hygrometricum]|uniref:Myosin-17 n=1 Tax=Dorcoceras hygrometricum TaxID=472368 RepID=A0A2Z7BAX6_9LAMI|nr:myosin-17 [Dorcoceras hygrometricum]KZV58702.1 myosin-17 [Dorcoceras hygrometricum]
MAPSVPRTHAAAALRIKQISLDNQSRMIRRLRTKLASERRESTAIKEGLEKKVSNLVRDLQIQRCDNHSLRNTVNLYHNDIDRRISQLVEAKKEHKSTQVALEASHLTIARLTEIGLSMSKKIERMKTKKQQARESHMECHNKMHARIQDAEDTIKEKHLIIEALEEEKASPLQTIQGLQEDNGAPAPFDDEWEEEPEEEGLEDIPLG